MACWWQRTGKVIVRSSSLPFKTATSGFRKWELCPHQNALPEGASLVRSDQPYAKIIQIIPDQIVTKKVIRKILLKDGIASPDLKEDILKIVVVERHHATGNIGIGFVQGFGLKKGAIGSSVAHDSHNLVIVGTNDQDISRPIETIKRSEEDWWLFRTGRVLASLPFPLRA